MTLQTHTVDGDTIVLHAHREIIECRRLGLALELYAIVVQIELGIGVGLVGIDEGRIDIVIADGLLPHTVLFQFVGIRIGAHGALVVVETLVHHIPLAHLAFEVLHDVGDVVLHNFQSLLAGPVLVVGLTAIGGYPLWRLLVPYETVTTHHHLFAVGEVHQLVGRSENEVAVFAAEGLGLHLVLGHEHIKLEAYRLRLRQRRVVQVVLIERDGRAYRLAVLVGIVFQRLLIGRVVDAVIVEGAQGALLVIRIVGIVIIGHILERYEADMEGIVTLHIFPKIDLPRIFISADVEVTIARGYTVGT